MVSYWLSKSDFFKVRSEISYNARSTNIWIKIILDTVSYVLIFTAAQFWAQPFVILDDGTVWGYNYLQSCNQTKIIAQFNLCRSVNFLNVTVALPTC